MKEATGENELTSLGHCRLFAGVAPDVCQFVMDTATPLKLQAGKRLFERGDESGPMFVVLKGRLEISSLAQSGRKVALNILLPGESIGEISMFDNFPRSASAAAQVETILQPISKVTFNKASARSPQLALNMINILCGRFRWVSNTVEDFALLPLERRLARRLLTLDERVADIQGNITITQSELADFVGASREATNKVLMLWKSQTIIDLRRGSVNLLKKPRLADIAHDGN